MSTPLTPLHPDANEQLDINSINELNDDDINDLDLNPDLDNLTDTTSNNNTESINPSPSPLQTTPIKTTTTTSKRPLTFTEDDEIFDDVDDFKPRINIGSPFSSNVSLPIHQQQQNATPSHNNGIVPKSKPKPRRLSMSQQSRFIMYCDNELMQIQRKFVQSQGLNSENGYESLVPLLKDLKTLVDFIWYSIDNSNPHTDYLLKTPRSNEYIPSSPEDNNNNSAKISTYFGQTSYLIKIADDLLDYIEKFKISNDDQVVKIFKFLFILDKIFIRLLNGQIPGGHKMNLTDAVRLCGIAERTRMKLPIFFESQNIHGYHYEVSKIYEETLDKCGN
ncbi:TFIIH complex subunit TFB6 NDAI_0E03750 [Naumovozyma dairenensis CBS 421]|uniref:Uncharacterized protein n=1 Tax=Naumovozyma dairenensis (strain ATCC 10597 / BCRC 20456 / CBS 421 / NBRC 0211 / NRRL Y-12639) TaxID=1071378 RepID=G0WBS2_NAUDC|nr:hypothetical protein NDAI_0E03750 [Naumovozyma dairenensis CBS 421]CCD25192.1 hypothetical protein NDAI_0E03750 [Naumovozyma dairenensis CBS 421]